MEINEEQISILKGFKPLGINGTVSFKKGDTVFVTSNCTIHTMPMRKYLASFGAKQVHKIEEATHVVLNNFSRSINAGTDFPGGVVYHKDSHCYVKLIDRHVVTSFLGEATYMKDYQNVFNIQGWNRSYYDGYIRPLDISVEFYLNNTGLVYMDEDLMQKLVYQYHKEHVWEKLTEDSLGSLLKLLSSDDDSNVDLGITMINQYNPEDIMKYLILAYYSTLTTIKTAKKLKDKVFKKDPELYRLVDNLNYKRHDTSNLYIYDIDVHTVSSSKWKHLIQPEDVSDFLDRKF